MVYQIIKQIKYLKNGFSSKNGILFLFTPVCFVGISYFINVICIYLRSLVSNNLFVHVSDDVGVV
jgi:hypothetical protein